MPVRPVPAFVALFALYMPMAFAAEETDRAVQLVSQLGLEEDTQPVRERKGWRVPRKIVLLGGAPEPHLQAMKEIAPQTSFVVVRNVSEAARAAVDADVLVGITNEFGVCLPEIVDNAKELRWILAMSAGVEYCVALPTLHSRDVLVTNLRAVGSAAIGEHAIALALALARNLNAFTLNMTKSYWNLGDPARAKVRVLTGKTMLVVGLGGIGTEVAKRAHGLGMKVVATRASSRTGPDYVSYVGLPDELLTLAKDADVIVNTAPLTPATTGLFNAEFFEAMKETAYFINVARGGSVVTEDLLRALTEGRIAGAGLDVTDPEPLPADHPLWRAPNLIITPHVGGSSDVHWDDRWLVARENLRRYVAGEKMLSVVDLKRGY